MRDEWDSSPITGALQDLHQRRSRRGRGSSVQLPHGTIDGEVSVSMPPASDGLDRKSRRATEYNTAIRVYEVQLEYMLREMRKQYEVEMVLKRGRKMMKFVRLIEAAIETGISEAQLGVYTDTFNAYCQVTARAIGLQE